LVERHGPMVLHVCRQVLDDSHAFKPRCGRLQAAGLSPRSSRRRWPRSPRPH
jgi:hypothetical protein